VDPTGHTAEGAELQGVLKETKQYFLDQAKGDGILGKLKGVGFGILAGATGLVESAVGLVDEGATVAYTVPGVDVMGDPTGVESREEIKQQVADLKQTYHVIKEEGFFNAASRIVGNATDTVIAAAKGDPQAIAKVTSAVTEIAGPTAVLKGSGALGAMRRGAKELAEGAARGARRGLDDILGAARRGADDLVGDASAATSRSGRTWQDFLPEAQARLDAAKARYGDAPIFAMDRGTSSTFSVGRSHLSSAEMRELMQTPGMKFTGTTGAGAARLPRHHVFPQEHRRFFQKRGFTDDRSIDNFTLELERGVHEALHGGGNFRLGRKWSGEWNRQIMKQIKAIERQEGRRLVFEEIMSIGEDMMSRYNLGGPFVPYRE
jgi:hypothetical protein